jgi:cell division protein YceG involved in septum cleavage
MKKFRDLAIFLLVSIGLMIIIAGSFFNYYLSPVSDDIIEKEVIIDDGKDIDGIASMLYDEKIIRNPKVFKIYLAIMGIDEMKEGSFTLKPSSSAKDIAKNLSISK